MWSIIAASVVDLPEPVVPVSRMIPRRSSASVADHRRQTEVLDRPHLVGDHAADDRDRAALAEGVDAEPRDARDRVGEVGLAVGVELLARRGRCRRAASRSASSVSSGLQRLAARGSAPARRGSAPSAARRPSGAGRSPRSRPRSAAHRRPERHRPSIGGPTRSLESASPLPGIEAGPVSPPDEAGRRRIKEEAAMRPLAVSRR